MTGRKRIIYTEADEALMWDRRQRACGTHATHQRDRHA